MKKTNILYIFIGICCAMASCVSEDELTPSSETIPISSVSATFAEGNYTYNLDPGALFIDSVNTTDFVIPIPWFYPESSDNETSISKMQLRASIGNGCSIDPNMTIYDLTQKHIFTLTDYNGNKKQISVTGNRFKLPYNEVEEMFAFDNVKGEALMCIVNNNQNEIYLLSVEDLPDVDITSITLSPHATASISTGTYENIDITTEPTLTVTAHNGNTKTYVLKRNNPEKREKGIRPGSGKIMFAKIMKDDLGIPANGNSRGFAATKDYLVINVGGASSTYIDLKTGEKKGEINLGAIQSTNLTNFYSTSDIDGNILINNLAPNAGTFKLWKLSSVSGTPELLIDWTNSGTYQIGRKVSIAGSLDGNAIITAGFHNATTKFARWTVVNGVLTSHDPEIITVSGYSWSNNNIDLVYTSPFNTTSDYYLVGYAGGNEWTNALARFSGATNTMSMRLNALSQNFVSNAVDFINFNNGEYVAYNFINGQPWGTADQVWVIDTNDSFTGNSDDIALWKCEPGRYGSWNPFAIQNGNATGDVAFRASEDGYYLYFYFMFTNGYVVGVQFDCIDM